MTLLTFIFEEKKVGNFGLKKKKKNDSIERITFLACYVCGEKKIRLNRNLFVFRSEVKIKVEDFPLDKDGTMWVVEKIRMENCADALGEDKL